MYFDDQPWDKPHRIFENLGHVYRDMKRRLTDARRKTRQLARSGRPGSEEAINDLWRGVESDLRALIRKIDGPEDMRSILLYR
ncbi:MAG: hypothetical protein HQL64_06185 [Magnetococcales bacterium]|nr:hypothetical protein [Magnetococcales bacterium]